MEEFKTENQTVIENNVSEAAEPSASATAEKAEAAVFEPPAPAEAFTPTINGEEKANKKRIKRTVSAANTVPIINMGASVIATYTLPFIVAYIYQIAVLISGSIPSEESYGYFVDYFFNGNGVVAQSVSMLIYAVLMAIGPLIFWIINSRHRFKEVTGSGKVSPSKFLYCTVFSIGISSIFNVIAGMILSLLSALGVDMRVPDFSAPSAEYSVAAMILYIISLTVMPALFEEFAYRGFAVFKIRKLAPYAAIFISSITFSLMHGTVTQIPGSFVFGLILGYFVVKYDCIWIGVVAHFLNNLFSILPDVISQYWNAPAIIDFGFSLFYSGIFVVTLCLVPVYLIRHGIKLDVGKDALGFKEGMKAVFTSAGFYIMLVFAVLNFVTTNFGQKIFDYFLAVLS